MKAVLVRVGIDCIYGGCNAPMNPNTNEFIYVPIHENDKFSFVQDGNRKFRELLPALNAFCKKSILDLYKDLNFPGNLLDKPMHLDPDFDYLTYGDVGDKRGKGIFKLKKGDLIVFYAGLKPVTKIKDNLVYALIGLYYVDKVLLVNEVLGKDKLKNAHTRRTWTGETDIVVFAQKNISGRFDKCIPIGEFRDKAYRVKKEILEEWGGMNIKDGYIQRSVNPPFLLNPEKFIKWLEKKNVNLMNSNN